MPNQLTGKLQVPLNRSHFGGEYEKGSTEPTNNYVNMELTQVQMAPETLQTKFKIMQRAVINCPSVCIESMGKLLESLLDSCSQVRLLQQSFYDRYLAPLLGPANGELAEAQNLFILTAANDESLPLTRCIELDVTFQGLAVPKVRFLVFKNPNNFIEDK